MKIAQFFRKNKSSKDEEILSKVDDIEEELKSIGFWESNPPKLEVSNYLEAPSFEIWLQCVFIPNARLAAKTGKYPKGSQVGLMALREYDYHSHIKEAQRLVRLLHEFDELIKT